MPRPIDPMLLAEMEKKDPSLVARYRERMQAADAGIADAEKSQNMAGYAGVAGQLASDFINSQRSDQIYHNRMQDLGKAPTIERAEKYQWDNSIADKFADRKMADAKAKRASVGSEMLTEQQFAGMDKQAAAEGMLKDPNSEESKRIRDGLRMMDPKFVDSIPNFEMLSAEQAQRIMPMLTAGIQKQREDQRHSENMAIKRDELKLKRDALFAKKEGENDKLSEGQKAVDKDYAKHYNTFTQKGAVNAKNSIENLEKLADEMEADSGYFQDGGGRFAKELPDAMRSRNAIRRRDSARNFANATLKELFGGNLSDGEREAAAREYYNDALDNAENAKILRAKIKGLKDSYNTEFEKAKYYEKYGTLKGFGGLPSGGMKTVVKKQYSPSTNRTKLIYDDGTEEVVDGKN